MSDSENIEDKSNKSILDTQCFTRVKKHFNFKWDELFKIVSENLSEEISYATQFKYITSLSGDLSIHHSNKQSLQILNNFVIPADEDVEEDNLNNKDSLYIQYELCRSSFSKSKEREGIYSPSKETDYIILDTLTSPLNVYDFCLTKFEYFPNNSSNEKGIEVSQIDTTLPNEKSSPESDILLSTQLLRMSEKINDYPDVTPDWKITTLEFEYYSKDKFETIKLVFGGENCDPTSNIDDLFDIIKNEYQGMIDIIIIGVSIKYSKDSLSKDIKFRYF